MEYIKKAQEIAKIIAESTESFFIYGGSGSGKTTINGEIVNAASRERCLLTCGESTLEGVLQTLDGEEKIVTFEEFDCHDGIESFTAKKHKKFLDYANNNNVRFVFFSRFPPISEFNGKIINLNENNA